MAPESCEGPSRRAASERSRSAIGGHLGIQGPRAEWCDQRCEFTALRKLARDWILGMPGGVGMIHQLKGSSARWRAGQAKQSRPAQSAIPQLIMQLWANVFPFPRPVGTPSSHKPALPIPFLRKLNSFPSDRSSYPRLSGDILRCITRNTFWLPRLGTSINLKRHNPVQRDSSSRTLSIPRRGRSLHIALQLPVVIDPSCNHNF